MQKGYRYELVEPIGRNLILSPAPSHLLHRNYFWLGVFGGKYMTDCRGEFPLAGLRASNSHRCAVDKSLIHFFAADAESAALGVAQEGLDTPGRSARLVPMVLPLLLRVDDC